MSRRPSKTDRRPAWVRLDNAANIFLAARNEIDTKVFRLSAELDEEIDPAVLQEALDRVYAQYPLFRAVLRRGVFWYYLQESDRSPVVSPDDAAAVTHLYRFDSRELLFRVLYRGRRISLEIFHALTDGTGSLWFFEDLIIEYVGLRHPADFPASTPVANPGVKQEFTVDAFTHWFRAGTGKVPFAEDATGAAESASALLSGDRTPERAPRAGGRQRSAPHRRRHRIRGVVRVRGVHTPDLRTRVVELAMPTKPMLELARTEGVSLTIYLIAVVFAALRSVRPPRAGERTMTVSVPVNLRQFFPTESGRNFFATTLLTHSFEGDEDGMVSEVCRALDQQFQPLLTHENLERKIRRLVDFERHPVLRVVPRPLKDLVLGLVNRLSNRGITVAMSNLGRVQLPDPVRAHVGRLYFHVSAIRPQFSVISHEDQVTVSFTSPFVETDYHAAFVRHFTSLGVPVTVNASRVTPEELAGQRVPATGRRP